MKRAVRMTRAAARAKNREPTVPHLDLHFLAGLYLDERFSGRAVLAIGLAPHGPAQHSGVIFNRNRFPKTAGRLRPAVTHAMSIVELIAANAHLGLQPAAVILAAGEQRPIRTGDLGVIAVGDRVPHEVSGGIGLAKNGHLAIEFLLHRGQQRRRSRLSGLRRGRREPRRILDASGLDGICR